MPYCSKCGIEIDSHIKKCPLCKYTIPEIETSEKNILNNEEKMLFPAFKNIYPKRMRELRKRFFYAVSILLLINISYFVYKFFIFKENNSYPLYVITILIGIWIYLLFILGFSKNRTLTITGIILNTTAINFFCDFITRRIDWFLYVSLPLIIYGSIILIIITVIFNYIKKKTINIILIIAVGIAAFIIGFEITLKLFLIQKIVLSWSVFFSAEIILLSLLILFFYHQIPKKILNKFKKKIHI